MKKQLALGIAGASAALVGGWRLIRQFVDRGEQTDAVAVPPGVPAEHSSERPATPARPAAAASRVSGNSSKAELYEVAQKLDIEGRSKMTKDQLLEAIRQAG
jgi:hypothetical protein